MNRTSRYPDGQGCRRCGSKDWQLLRDWGLDTIGCSVACGLMLYVALDPPPGVPAWFLWFGTAFLFALSVATTTPKTWRCRRCRNIWPAEK